MNTFRTQIAGVMRQNAERLKGHRVFVFGSRETGSARPHSDFDINVVGGKPLPLIDFYAINQGSTRRFAHALSRN